MSKKEIKEKLLRAIEKDPHKKDFKKVSIFGSYAYGNPGKRSDVDVLIEFVPRASISLFRLAGIQINMADTLHKKVDLVTREGLHKFIKREVLANAQTIYQASLSSSGEWSETRGSRNNKGSKILSGSLLSQG